MIFAHHVTLVKRSLNAIKALSTSLGHAGISLPAQTALKSSQETAERQEIAMQTNSRLDPRALSGLVFSPAPLHPRNQPAIRIGFLNHPGALQAAPVLPFYLGSLAILQSS